MTVESTRKHSDILVNRTRQRKLKSLVWGFLVGWLVLGLVFFGGEGGSAERESVIKLACVTLILKISDISRP